MKDIFTVAKFTAVETVKKKAFIVSLIIILSGIVIGFNIPNIIKLFNNNTSELTKILIIDEKDIYKGSLKTLNEMNLGYEFEIINENKTMEEIEKTIFNDGYEAAIQVNDSNGISIDYIAENLGLTGGPSIDSGIFSNLYQVVRLSELGLTEKEIMEVNSPLMFNVIEFGDGSSGNIVFISMMFSLLLFFAIYYCAYQVAMSITVEKTSKIIDTLITSTPPKAIVWGKTLGIGLVGLFEVLLIAIVGVISYNLFFPAETLAGIIDLSGISIMFLVISIVYFILGYTFYAFIYAFSGSLVSKPEDVQSISGLVSIIVIIGFYLSYFSMMNPASNLNKWATMLPISSPFSVPSRFMTGAASGADVLISIIILIISSIIIAIVATKIYSSAILNYGTKLDMKNIIKMFKQKDN